MQEENAHSRAGSLSGNDLQYFVALCRFKTAWDAGDRPRAEDFVAQWPADERDALLPRLLALELEIREQSGERLNLDEIAERFPDNPHIAIDLLHTVDRAYTKLLSVPPDEAGTQEPGAADDCPELGRYRVTRRVGVGGFGVVYVASDRELDRSVAIKVLHRRWISLQSCVDDFLKEARVVARLDHPNIVPVFDCGQTGDGRPFVVSKFIEGSNLRERLKRGRPSFSETTAIVAAVADALHYAHLQRLVHRDVKPSNILIDVAGKAYLADFGMVLREQEYGQGPTFAGTPAYMSPEQARSEGHRVDGRSDIFSLGVVYYEMLTGRKPFEAESNEDLLNLLIEFDPRPPRQIDDAISRELERICFKALSKRASDRYSTAHDMAEDLRYSLKLPAVHRSPPATNGTSQSAPGAADAIDHSSAPIETTPSAAPSSAPSFDRLALKIVPKGLRSFDGHDADFFLELLPGPRDREGLPESIRFWKTRIEETDPDETFPVGLIYGPSGCGKSSLIKAGLLPRLSDTVQTVYVEATGNETELRLLTGLRKRFPTLSQDGLSLSETVTALRRGPGVSDGRKVLIVLDQFEQWLHSNIERDSSELVLALRQCDGARVQCVLTVRDDFWLAVSRFLRNLEVRLVEGHNSALADLFDTAHARKVLTAFGQAFGKLPEYPTDLGKDAKAFLKQAVAGLAQDNKIVSVRLALFAEMMKSREWTVESLKEVGGTAGIGVTFLEETFSASTAPPEHRFHQSAARSVLNALLPETGANIKGHMLATAELFAASGYEHRPDDFDRLMGILDSELRLVTPTDPEGKMGPESTTADVGAGQRFYQLTHDYLVPSLREWLTRKQKETPQGRAELLLADRAGVWNARPENRQLPSLWQWTRILRWTNKRNWTAPQQKMMARATRHHGFWTLAVAGLVVVSGVVGWEIFGRTESGNLTRDLLRYPTASAPDTIRQMGRFRPWVNPLLYQALAEEGDPKRRLRARLGLLPVDPGQLPEIQSQLLICDPEDFLAIREMLAKFPDQTIGELWNVLVQNRNEEGRRLRAACALAQYDLQNEKWTEVSPDVASILVAQSPAVIGYWIEALSLVHQKLLQPLAGILADEKRTDLERSTATSVFAEIAKSSSTAWTDLANGLARSIDVNLPCADRIAEARRRANIGVTLIQEDHFDLAQPIVKAVRDPTARTFLIHGLGLPRVQPQALFAKLQNPGLDPLIRQAVILTLGQFDVTRIPKSDLAAWAESIGIAYRTDNHPGVHGAAEWLLRRWNETERLAKLDAELLEKDHDISRRGVKPADGRLWYMDSQGQTMVIVPAPGEFWVGEGKNRHKRVLRRDYAIGSKEVTLEQYQAFRREHGHAEKPAPDPRTPVLNLTWYEAAEICNWLSAKERIPEDQWCYEKNDQGKFGPGMKIVADAVKRSGYRLATDIEWEYACQAGSVTTFSFGEAEELARYFAWHVFNSNNDRHAVGLLKPNNWGLFDMHGNAAEWCQGAMLPHPRGEEAQPLEELPDAMTVNDRVFRPLRGGYYGSAYIGIRTANVNWLPPSGRLSLPGAGEFRYSCGFRVARTISGFSSGGP